MTRVRLTVVLMLMCVAASTPALAQGRGRLGAPPRSAREAAPVDLTGYWVSVISEDWRWRMVTPLKGDYASLPLNGAGIKVAETWDPDKDTAAGLACKAYGAAAIMRMPGRVRITWQDDSTLRLDFDSGGQTRLFHFGGTKTGDGPSWQGYSVANWESPPRGVGTPSTIPIFARRIGTGGRSLEVMTSNLRAGYLRKNGVPYSENAAVAEYFDYRRHPNGDEWFTVTTIVRDPTYLDEPLITSSDFKKEPDGSRFQPGPCEAR
jgi:hypothetical protein